MLIVLFLMFAQPSLSYDVKILDSGKFTKEQIYSELESINESLLNCVNYITFYNTELDIRRGYYIDRNKQVFINLYLSPDFRAVVRHEARHCVWHNLIGEEEKIKYCSSKTKEINYFSKSSYSDFYDIHNYCAEVYADE